MLLQVTPDGKRSLRQLRANLEGVETGYDQLTSVRASADGGDGSAGGGAEPSRSHFADAASEYLGAAAGVATYLAVRRGAIKIGKSPLARIGGEAIALALASDMQTIIELELMSRRLKAQGG